MNILATCLVLLSATTVYEATFDQGNEAYQRGDYAQAVHAYEQLIASGVEDPVVFYNLATARYRLGDLGHAVLNYERALYLQPRFAAARDNLNRVLRDTERSLPRPPTTGLVTGLLGSENFAARSLLWISAVFWFLFWAVCLLRLWKTWPYLWLAASVLLILALVNLAAAYERSRPSPIVVTVVEYAPVRFGTNVSEQVRFELYEGDRVLMDGRQGDWIRIQTADGERGWAQQAHLIEVGPPYRLGTEDAHEDTTP